MPRPHSCLKILILIVNENPPGITSRKDRQERKEVPPAPSSGIYANGVELQSPVSRSARWVTDHLYD